ncbi:MAG: ATP-binding protein [Bacteroidota bacterium]
MCAGSGTAGGYHRGKTADRLIFITTQYPFAKWHHRMPDPTMADVFCDRLTSIAYKFNMKRDYSMRIKNK